MNDLVTSLRGLFLDVLDIILPERARAARVRKRGISDYVLSPTVHDLRGVRITTLLNYKDAGVSDLVRALKYEHSGHAARLCAEVLTDFLREEIAGMRAFSARTILLVPMPLHTNRLRSRGFNQIEKVLRHVPREYTDGILARLATDALVRTRDTPQQTRLSRGERAKNVAGAFAADDAVVGGTHVILIDDVTTTGATLAECVKILKKAGAKVTAIALARA